MKAEADTRERGGLSKDQREKIRQLEALGYVSGVSKATGESGIVMHDRSRSWESLNLWVSGHDPVAYLMDMDGKVLHSWAYTYDDAFGHPPPNDTSRLWRRVHLYPNGDLLAIFEGRALVKLTRDSKLLWVYQDRCHHQMDVTDDGSIYVLSREPKVKGKIHETEPIIEDFVSVLDEDGQLLRRVSILEAFQNSRYHMAIHRTITNKLKADIVKGRRAPGDVFHTNAIQVLDGVNSEKSPAFKRGNVLISLRELNVVAILNLDETRIEWVSWGMWATQHDPVLLPNGRMLIFDNRGNRGASRVMEFDPFTQEVFWEYAGDPPKSFRSRSCGASQRLPNGNTLITESDNGRAFEVTRDGSIIWKFVSPHRVGENGDLVARLFDMVRVPRDLELRWLEE